MTMMILMTMMTVIVWYSLVFWYVSLCPCCILNVKFILVKVLIGIFVLGLLLMSLVLLIGGIGV